MAYKIYIKTNIFYIHDTVTDYLYEGHAKDVLARRQTPSSTNFYFNGVNQFQTSKAVSFSDIQDENGDAYTDLSTFVTFLEDNTGKSSAQEGAQITGWGSYTDTLYTSVSPLVLTGGAAYVNLTNNKGSFLETQKPTDVDTFYDGTTITGRFGDSIMITISFAVKPTTNQSTRVTVIPDIGGVVGEITDYEKDETFSKGLNIVQRYLNSFGAYTYDTWEANGAQLKIKADQNAEIYNIRYLINRLHKAF